MRNISCVLLTLGLLWGFIGGTSLAETMYAKKNRVKVTAEKSPTSTTVATLSVGDQVEVLKKSGRQYQVQLGNGKTGWVFRFKLTPNKPSASSGGGSGLSGLTGKNVIAAREARAGGSIRGLKETTEQYAEQKQINSAHRRAVDNMEQLVISDQELTQFKKEGKVGEYAGGGQ